jgi:hypothetical protein
VAGLIRPWLAGVGVTGDKTLDFRPESMILGHIVLVPVWWVGQGSAASRDFDFLAGWLVFNRPVTQMVSFNIRTEVRRFRILAMNNLEKSTHNERAAARRSCEPPGLDGSLRFFRNHQLWELAEGLPIKEVLLSELDGFDDVRWFGGGMNVQPTCRAIAHHARDIYAADLSYLIKPGNPDELPTMVKGTRDFWLT